jgi:heme exporter protein D
MTVDGFFVWFSVTVYNITISVNWVEISPSPEASEEMTK